MEDGRVFSEGLFNPKKGVRILNLQKISLGLLDFFFSDFLDFFRIFIFFRIFRIFFEFF